MAEGYFYGTGRRKSAVARVFMKRGSGAIIVNGKPIDQFFSRETGRMIVRQPLELGEQLKGFDIKVNVGRTGTLNPYAVHPDRLAPSVTALSVP